MDYVVDPRCVQGSMQPFMSLQDLYEKNMEYAILHRTALTDPVPEDDAEHVTRSYKKRRADFVLWCEGRKEHMLPKIDRFIEELPGMLADAQKLGFGADETFIMRSEYGCNCVEKSGVCAGHVFEYRQYFWSWTDDNATCPNSPASPE